MVVNPHKPDLADPEGELMPRATNKHHIWWPRTQYKKPLERKFRELPCNVVVLQVSIHDLLHTNSEPPLKPTEDQMAAAIRNHENRRCPCATDLNSGPERRRHE